MKVKKLFRSGGSYAVRIPKSWVPRSHEVILRREGDRIVITEAGCELRELAQSFAEDGFIDFSRPEQPQAPDAGPL
jgi:virulence-associated protein VagC